MGDRANIILKQEEGGKIYLYTHWGGHKIKQVLAKALDRSRSRWDDEPYLSRIIFSELIKDDIDGLTGYGLTTYMTDEDNNDVEVDIEAQTADGLPFDAFITMHK